MSNAVSLSDIKFALFTAKLRRMDNNSVCQIAAITPGTTIQVDCSNVSRLRMRSEAIRFGKSRLTVSPLDRGHIADVILRTRLHHGLDEVRKTWGVGIKALLAEPKYVLKGGRA